MSGAKCINYPCQRMPGHVGPCSSSATEWKPIESNSDEAKIARLQAQVETLTQELKWSHEGFAKLRESLGLKEQQLADALRINSALRDAIQDARANLFVGSDEYIKDNVGHILAAALTQSAEVPSGAAKSWLIFFEDADVRPEIYTDSESARSAFEVRKQSWSCHLFVEVPEPPSPIPAAQEEQS